MQRGRLPSSSFLSLPLSSLALPLEACPLKSRAWGNAVSSPAGSGAKPQPTNDLVHFSLKIWHLVATILISSCSVKRLLWQAPSPPLAPALLTWGNKMSLCYIATVFFSKKRLPGKVWGHGRIVSPPTSATDAPMILTQLIRNPRGVEPGPYS